MYQEAFIYQDPYQVIAKSRYTKTEIMSAMLSLKYHVYIPFFFSVYIYTSYQCVLFRIKKFRFKKLVQFEAGIFTKTDFIQR